MFESLHVACTLLLVILYLKKLHTSSNMLPVPCITEAIRVNCRIRYL